MEVIALRNKNAELVDKLKRMNEELVNKVLHHRPKAHTEIEPGVREGRILDEMNGLKSAMKVYHNEIEHLNNILKHKTGSDRVLELSTKIAAIRFENEQAQKHIKQLAKETKESERILEKEFLRRQNDAPELEVTFSPTLRRSEF